MLRRAQDLVRRQTRFDGRLALVVLVSAAATLLITTCASGVSASTGAAAGPRASSSTAARDKMRSSNADGVTGLAHVMITPDSLSAMMQQDLAANQAYIAWVRTSQGDAAAARVEDNILAPYQHRIDQMKSLNVDHQDFDIQVVTVWSSLTFSTRSYDVNFGPMDPVSLLFTGNGAPDSVYQDLTTTDPCLTDAQCRLPAFQDDKGTAAQARGFGCQSQTQWVLMGDAGQPLQWRPSSRGVMATGDKCTQGVRDHMRIFGGVTSAVFGAWSVATPHKEAWSDAGGKFGHIIQSWTDARNDFAAFWQSFAKRPGVAGPVLPSLNWGSGGFYQNVEFDGRGMAIELCPCP